MDAGFAWTRLQIALPAVAAAVAEAEATAVVEVATAEEVSASRHIFERQMLTIPGGWGGRGGGGGGEL